MRTFIHTFMYPFEVLCCTQQLAIKCFFSFSSFLSPYTGVGPITSPSHISQSNLGPNFILTWGPPTTGYCLPDSYILTHTVNSRLACPDEEVTKVVEEVTDITVTTYLLNNLDYYSEYEINITGINELGPGETVTYYAPTIDGGMWYWALETCCLRWCCSYFHYYYPSLKHSVKGMKRILVEEGFECIILNAESVFG